MSLHALVYSNGLYKVSGKLKHNNENDRITTDLEKKL